MNTTLPEIVANKSRQFIKPIKNAKYSHKDCGKLIVVCEELNHSKQIAKIKFRLSNVKVSGCFSLLVKPSVFLKVSRCNEDSTFSVVYESKTKWYTRNPEFEPIQIKVRTLCNADFDRTIKIDVFDFSAAGDHKIVGSVNTSLNKLINKTDSSRFEVINQLNLFLFSLFN